MSTEYSQQRSQNKYNATTYTNDVVKQFNNT
jgi:hypothetical protein